MKHTCGGDVDVMSVSRVEPTVVEVVLICTNCGEIHTAKHYLYNEVE